MRVGTWANRKRPLRVAIALTAGGLGIMTMALFGALPSIADPWGTNTAATGAHPDEDPHTYCIESSLGGELGPNVSEAEWQAADPTEVNVNGPQGCNYSGAGETDVVWREGSAGGALGETFCEDFESSSNQCDQSYVTLNLAVINQGINDEIDQSITTCHELGHTLGLTHGQSADQDDCMRNVSTSDPPNNIKWRRYGAHHINAHINPWF